MEDCKACSNKLIHTERDIIELRKDLTELQKDHDGHRAELKELATAVSKLSSTINRAMYIAIGAATVITFLANGQFAKIVNTGNAVVQSQEH